MKRTAFAVSLILLFHVYSGFGLQLLYSDRRDIRLLETNTDHRNSNESSLEKDTILADKLDDAIAVGFHFKQQMLFWTDVSLEKIMRKSLIKGNKPEVIISTGLVRPEGLAVDWVTNKFYWTDSHSKLIEVANMDGSQRSVLFWNNVDQPRAIVVDPLHGYMFWSDWGEEAKIVRAGMDASGRTNLITKDIKWPNGLAVDYEDPRLYWLDAHSSYSCVASSDLNGNDRRKIVEGSLPHPFAITIFGERVYWTDWTTKSIHSCHKKTGDGKWLVKDKIDSLMDLQAFDQKRQPKVDHNPCAKQNGGCSHLCLLAPHGGNSCACPTGVALLSDRRTCQNGPQNFILVARRTELRLLSLDTPDHTAVVLPIHNIQQAVVIEFDPVEGFVYWTDQDLHMIKRARLNGSDELTVAAVEVKFPEGIAVDWIGRNLYWSDTGTDRIEVCHLNGTSRRVLVSEELDEPRAMALDPGEGYLYWTDWGANPRIERAWLDGTHRQVLVNSSIKWPNGLAIDYVGRKIYWGDAKLDKIEVCNLNGSGRKVLLDKELPHIYGFGLIGKHIYWTDWQRRNLQKVHIASESKDIIVEQLPDVMGLKVVNVNIAYGANDCQKSNGGCSHLCLYTPAGVQCECPMGLELTKDNKSCVVPEAFLLFTRSGSIRRISIDSSNGDKPIPIPGIEDVNAVDFHINESRVFWTDFRLNQISRAFLNGSMAEVVIGIDVIFPDGLAVDWVANNLYWTDSYLDRIECARTDGRYRKTLIWKNMTEPHSLALDPRNGYMYWSQWGDAVGIYRAQMDGSGMQILLQNFTYVERPNSLVIDFFEDRLYWTDEHINKILRANLDGSNMELVVSSHLPHPNCLTQYKDFIYWGDMQEGTISRANKQNGDNRTRIEGHLGLIMDMKVFHGSRQIGWNECGVDNGGCSHLCLALTHQKYTCACPNHYVLDETNTTCSAPELFLLYSNTKEVRRLTLNQNDDLDVILPLQIRHRVRCLAYDPNEDMVYWIDEYGDRRSIFKSFGNGSKSEMVTTDKEILSSPIDLALDPYGKQLYWTDDITLSIKVTSLKTEFTGIIVNGGRSRPRSIALDPKRGFMYWTNFTGKIATIEKARMNGARDGKTALMKMKLGTMEPGKLAADPNGEFLYFVEVKNRKIVKLSLKDLTHNDLLVENLLEPKSLSVNNDFLYCLDKESGNIKKINKHTGKNEALLVRGGIKDGTDVLVIDKTSIDTNHPCYNNNGGCSKICSVINNKAVCSCPKYLILDDDQKTCKDPPTCGPNKFPCKSGGCIHLVWKCDGEVECDDNSDEENCPTCGPNQFTCDNKQCVDKREKCDGISLCSDESDLKKCKKCKDDEFQCKNDKCIPINWKCDAVDDCEDNSDEGRELCVNVTKTLSPGHMGMKKTGSSHKEKIVIVCICGVALVAFFVIIYFFKRAQQKPDGNYGSAYIGPNTPLSNVSSFYDAPGSQFVNKAPKSDERSLSITSNPTDTGEEYYNREDLTGRSRSTVQPSYVHSLENPPPSPATYRSNYTSVSEKYCASPSPSCRQHRQYRPTMSYYATPASTDIESSVSKYVPIRKPLSSAYSSVSSDCESAEYDNAAPPPPPPTICTNYYSDVLQLSDNEDLPPSPSSESCFIIEPDPPPPSPVTDSPSVA